MSDMPGAAVPAVVGAQAVAVRPSGHKLTQVGDGVTLPLVCLLAGARSHLGASGDHHYLSFSPYAQLIGYRL
jgi:hypothetical protein